MTHSRYLAVIIAVTLTGLLTRPAIAQDENPALADTPALAEPAEVPDRAQNQDTEPAFRSPLRSETLKYADAPSAAQALSKLFSLAYVASDESSNTVFFRADDAMLNEIHRFFGELETIASNRHEQKVNEVREDVLMLHMSSLQKQIEEKMAALSGLHNQLGPGHPSLKRLQEEVNELQTLLATAEYRVRNYHDRAITPDTNRELQRERNLNSRIHLLPWMPSANFAKEFQRLEDLSRDLAADLRQRGADSDEADGLEMNLRKTVEQAFDARQKIQSTHAEALRKQLEAIESRIQRREELREKIIERRIDELVSEPELEAWDSSISPKPIMLRKGRLSSPDSETP